MTNEIFTEEQITKAILVWLEGNGWSILCYDFPQSGTAISLHPNDEYSKILCCWSS